MKTLKNKNNILYRKQLSKLVIVFVVFSILSNINLTYAYFNDEVVIEGTEFTAGTLEITINSEDAVDLGLMYPGDINNSVYVDISNTGTLDSQYVVKTIPTGSDNSACNYITVTAADSTNPSNPYEETVNNFISETEDTIDTTWNFSLKVNNNTPASVWGKTCSFKWVYTAWQTNLPDASSGFTSTKEKLGEINIGKVVVMNEILPNPEGLDTQAGLQGEWVELYNNGNISLDLAGWKIKDAAGNTKIISTLNTFNGRTTIGPKGSYNEWVVVFMNDDIMNNTGDTISFYDPTENLIDSYSYGNSGNDNDSDSNSTGGGSNGNPVGGETAGNEGKSDARIPDGIGAWVDPIPTPGEPNELSEEIIPKVKEPAVELPKEEVSEIVADVTENEAEEEPKLEGAETPKEEIKTEEIITEIVEEKIEIIKEEIQTEKDETETEGQEGAGATIETTEEIQTLEVAVE